MPATLIGLLLVSPLLSAQPPADQATPKQQFEALLKEYQAANAAYGKRFEATMGKDDGVARYLAWPAFEFGPRFLKLAEAHPHDPAAPDALLWIIRTTKENDRQFCGDYARSLELLLKYHLHDKRIGRACLFLANNPSAAREKFLRAVFSASTDREVRGRVCFGLAETLLHKRDYVLSHEARGAWFVRHPFNDFFAKERLAPDFLSYFQAADVDALANEAANLFEQVRREYAEIKYAPRIHDDFSDSTLGTIAEQNLFDLRNLSIGSPSPETSGVDIEGKPMRLTDYRGKVVVLSFWGTWCGPCMSMVPYERTLVKRLEGKPFALLGVDADEDREKARKVMAAEGMTWPSWWDGRNSNGPISSRWNVRGWPTFIVLDHRGVIRFKAMAGSMADLDTVVDKLVRDIDPGRKP